MAEEKTNQEKLEDIICKVDDVRLLYQTVGNTSDEIQPSINCFDRLLLDIERDLNELYKCL